MSGIPRNSVGAWGGSDRCDGTRQRPSVSLGEGGLGEREGGSQTPLRSYGPSSPKSKYRAMFVPCQQLHSVGLTAPAWPRTSVGGLAADSYSHALAPIHSTNPRGRLDFRARTPLGHATCSTLSIQPLVGAQQVICGMNA